MTNQVWGNITVFICFLSSSEIWIKQEGKKNRLHFVSGLAHQQGECGSNSPCVLLGVRCPHPPSERMLFEEYCRIICPNTPIRHSDRRANKWVIVELHHLINHSVEKCSNWLFSMSRQQLQVKGAWLTALLANLESPLCKLFQRFPAFMFFAATLQELTHLFCSSVFYYHV